MGKRKRKRDTVEEAAEEKQLEVERAELDTAQEINQEKMRELADEAKDEDMRVWISDNYDTLAKEYLELYEDEFDLFCKAVYLKGHGKHY